MSQPSRASLTLLEEIVGGTHVLTDATSLDARQVDGMRPSVVLRPADAAQISEVIRFAASEKIAVIPCGGCTKLGVGSPPSRYDIALDLTRMNRILAYDPRDLTLGVEPGARIEDLLQTLSAEKQFLPLAVPFSDRATIGGIVAANSSSPLRHAYGGMRDFCLGMEFVTGEGSAAKSGGRVVKNVTGYDLHKLLIGSLGTLGAITRLNFRTFPLPRAQGTFIASFSDAEAAFGFCREITQSVLTPQMVEVADPGAAHFILAAEAPERITAEQWSVMVTAAGQPTVVDRHARELGHMAAGANADEFVRLSDAEQTSIVARIREFPRLLLEAASSAMIFRIGVVPTAMAPLLMQLGQIAARDQIEISALTRASGVAYVGFLPEESDVAPFPALATLAGEVFQACHRAEINANAMLEWCPAEVKRAIGGVWGPSRPDFALMKRVKNAFDPQSVLSPGRFAGEA